MQRQIQARDGIIESSHATLVVQNMFVKKQSQALHAKETKKQSKRGKLSMEGRGRHLTSQEWIEKTEEMERLREEEAAAKVQRAADREVAKTAKEALRLKWEEIKADHERAVEDWKSVCQRLTEQGVKKKHHPKKPKRPLKPKAPTTSGAPDDSGDDDSSSEDE